MSATESTASRWRRRLWFVVPPFLMAMAVIGLWYVVSELVLTDDQDFLLPPPHEVIASGFLDSDHLSELLEGLRATTVVTLVGLTISIIVGMSISIVMYQFRWVESTVFPYAIVVQATPIIAIVPLIGVWMGFSFNARVLVVVIISIFPIITNTLFGLKSVDRNHLDLFALHGAGGLTRIRKLLLPAAAPSIFTGFRIAAGLAVVGAIVGGFFFKGGQEKGLGRLISRYQLRLQTEQLMAAIILSSLLGVVLFLGVGMIGNRLTRAWHTSGRQSRT